MSKDIETVKDILTELANSVVSNTQDLVAQQDKSVDEMNQEDVSDALKSIQKIIERDILGYGSLHKPQCSLHEKYTSACCGCQRSRAACHAIEDYKEFISNQALTNVLYGKGDE